VPNLGGEVRGSLAPGLSTTVTRVGKNVYVTREEADQDMAVVCK
jgi:hypothetical protein